MTPCYWWKSRKITDKQSKRQERKGKSQLNLTTTRVISTRDQARISIDGKEISTLTSYKFLASLITSDGYNREGIKRRISLGNAATSK
jgi:hypothetical protein